MGHQSKHIRFDWAIKRLLRQKSNFGILEGFLTELLGFDVTINHIGESEGNKNTHTDKFNRVDILAVDDKGELILIEVQNEKQHDYFHRMNYGQAKLITDYMESGYDYENVRKVYSINIVYFELGQGDDYIYLGTTDFCGIHNPKESLQLSAAQKELYSKHQVSDLFATYYIIKVNNFDNIAHDSLDEWIYFLKNSEIKDSFKAKGLTEAKEKLRVDSMEKNEKEEYDNFIKDQRIRESEIRSAIAEMELKLKKEQEQKEEAQRQKEEAQKKQNEALSQLSSAIINLYKTGMPVSEIAKMFGKSEDEIKEIISE